MPYDGAPPPPLPFDAINSALLSRYPGLLHIWFPQGRVCGNEFVLGDISGAPGESLSINMRTGVWNDFAAGTTCGHDPLGLYAAAFHNGNLVEAAKRAMVEFGITAAAAERPPPPKEDVWDPGIAPEGEPEAMFRGWDAVFRYRDATGHIAGYVLRKNNPDGSRRKITPLNYGRLNGKPGWYYRQPAQPRPLYRLDDLARRPDAPVLVCEGEKGADAAAALFPQFVCITWPNGSSNVARADWSPLEGRNIVIWPDADLPGYAAAREIAERFPSASILDVLDDPTGADAADLKVPDPQGWLAQRTAGPDHAARVISAAIAGGLPIRGPLPDRAWIAAHAEAAPDVAPPPSAPSPAAKPAGPPPGHPAGEPWQPPGAKRDRKRAEPGGALIATDVEWREADIPRRPWIAPGYLLRGAVTILAGPPGASKSTAALNLAAAVALGQQWGRLQPLGIGNVIVLNAEDDDDEQRRRLSGVLRGFGAPPVALRGRLIRVSAEQSAGLLEWDQRDGAMFPTERMDQLEALARDHRADVVILDPMAELHNAPENDNGAVHAIMGALRSFAVRHRCAVLCLHHTRKGAAGGAGDPDIARGASSVIGAARVVLTLLGMTGEEADALGVPRDQARHFIRLDGAKSNYSALADAEWFERHSIGLDNGDGVAVLTPWTPPAETGLADDTLAALLAAVANGDHGSPWTRRLGNFDRSISRPMAKLGITSRAGQARALEALFAAGVVEANWTKANRHPATGLRHPDGRPNVAWTE